MPGLYRLDDEYAERKRQPLVRDPWMPADAYFAPDLTPPPSLSETMGASFRLHNLVGSAMASERGNLPLDDLFRIDRDHDPFAPDVIKGYEEHADRFIDSFNDKMTAAIKADIDREKRDRETLAASGWTGIGTDIAATLIDPTILLPGGALVKAGRFGYSALRTARSVGTAAAGATAIQEAGLHATQQTRTGLESATAIGGSFLLGGLLGGVGARLMTRADFARASKAIEDAFAPEFDTAVDIVHDELRAMASNLSAAASPADTLADLAIAGTAASKVAKATAQLNPLLRTLQSPSKAVRSVGSRLMENPVYLKKNLEGRGDIAAETAMHEFTRGAVVQALEAQRKAYLKARKAHVPMTEKQFREAVGMAMRRNDQSDIPGVAEAAKAWRVHVIEPLKQRAIETGQLPADVETTTAASYFSRVYNRPKIEAQEGAFKAVVRDWLRGEIEKEVHRAAKASDRRMMSLSRQKSEVELGMRRRVEETRRRMEGGEIAPDDFSERDIVELVRRARSGERTKAPETLSEWLRKQRGGIYDPTGELAAVYPDIARMPGMLRKSRKGQFNPRGGESLDDIVLRAWEDGFLNDAGAVRQGSGRDTLSERPSIRDFLDALESDLRGERVVRLADIDTARAADEFDQVLEALDRIGVDLDGPKFGTSDSMRDIASRVNRVLDDMDRARVEQLNEAMRQASARKPGEAVSDIDLADHIDEIVDDVFAKVTGRGFDGELPANITIAARGPLKGRTLNIPDLYEIQTRDGQLIRFEDFLDSDAEFVGRRYARIMAADVELAERFGSPDLAGPLDDIAEEYRALRKAVEKDKSLDDAKRQKALQALSDREKADLRDIEAVRDMLRGNYRPEIQHTTWARIGRAANAFNYMRALGGVVIASLTDAFRPAMVHGLKAYMGEAIRPLMTNTRAIKLSAKEAKLAGAVTERWLASRLATLAEITDPYALRSPFERFIDNAAAGFSKLTGLLHWNDFQKTIASTLTQNRILENAVKAAEKGFASLPARERAYMGYLGIGEGVAEDLGRLFARHGETLDGVRIANSERWGDDPAIAALRRAYRSAINKDVDSIIVTKGVGDAPLFAATPLGRAVLQFKTFALASNQRVLIRGLQEDKARFVGGVVGMSAIGMFVYFLKQMESGRDLSDNPGTWIAEGLDRSGIFSVAFEVNNALEKAGAPGMFTGAAAAFPHLDQRQPASRFAVRSTVGGFLGPTFGAATDTVGLMSSAFAGLRGDPDLKAGDIQAMRRLTPYASLPYWRWAIDGFLVPEAKRAVEPGLHR